VAQDLAHRRAGFYHCFRAQTFREKISASMLGIRQVNVAYVIDDTAVNFFRHALVKTSIARFHMKYRDLASFRWNCDQTTVRIAKKQQCVGLFLREHLIRVRDDIAYRSRKTFGRSAQEIVRFADAELPEKNAI